jgi:hypothetical protein
MTFEDRLRAAVRAGWWTLGIATSLLVVQWIAYLVLVRAQPAWFLWLWGPNVTWAQAQSVWLAAMAVFKLGVLAFALIVVWATVWRRMLLQR